MKIIVDSNIVFSAILNSQGKIGQLIINGSTHFKLFSVGLLKEEILNHKTKIISISGLTQQQFDKSLKAITDRINFIDEILISDIDVKKAFDLVSGIDEKDTLFVALTNHLNAKLWTGDKKLVSGLSKKGYTKTISTDELHKIFLEKQFKTKKRLK
jgi:predicted nucleic acid-binding protein